MSKVIEWINSKILWIFGIITTVGFIVLFWFHSEEQPNVIGSILEALDVASAVALAILAFFGYMKYTQEQAEKKKYEKSLKELNLQDIKESEVAILIQFGGQSDMIEPMKKYINDKLNFKGKIITADQFGDNNNNIKDTDIFKLKKYCQKVRSELSIASKVHIFYGGACIGYAVIADILNNSTNLLFYHKDGSDYKIWYQDIKSDKRQEEDLKLI